VRYLPIEQVGGDYCQVRLVDSGNCYITLSDVTGHGIGPALLATRVSSEVRHCILQNVCPKEIIRQLNTLIHGELSESRLYLTFFAARIDFKKRKITWSGAGHPPAFLIRRHGFEIIELQSQNLMIGVLENGLYENPEGTVSIEPGDRLVVYSDGITEAVDEKGQHLGIDNLKRLTLQSMSFDLFEVADFIVESIAQFHGPTADDKTLIVSEIRGNGTAV